MISTDSSLRKSIGIGVVNKQAKSLILLEIEDPSVLLSFVEQYSVTELLLPGDEMSEDADEGDLDYESNGDDCSYRRGPDVDSIDDREESRESGKRKHRVAFPPSSLETDLSFLEEIPWVKVIRRPRSQFKHSVARHSSVVNELRRLCLPTDQIWTNCGRTFGSFGEVIDSADQSMPNALVAMSVILDYIRAHGDQSMGVFSVKIGELLCTLSYDDAANHALKIFPDRREDSSITRVDRDGGDDTVHGDHSTASFDSSKSNAGEAKNGADYLFGIINKTKTPMGERNLRCWVQNPLKRKDEIIRRQNLVEIFYTNVTARSALRTCLQKFPDFERLLSKLRMPPSHSTLMDLLAIYRCNLHLQSMQITLIDMEDPDGVIKEAILDSLFQISGALSKYNALVENIVDVQRLKSKDNVLGTKWVQVK